MVDDKKKENINDKNIYYRISEQYNKLLFKICIYFGVLYLLQTLVFTVFIVSYFWSPSISVETINTNETTNENIHKNENYNK